MKIPGLILTIAGLILIMRYSEGEFSGTAEDEARRRKLRWASAGLVLAGQALQFWE
jgi:hypothetical protein